MQNNTNYIKTTKTAKQAKPQGKPQQGKKWERTDKRQMWN